MDNKKQEKPSVAVKEPRPVVPDGLNITLAVLENTMTGHTGSTITANPHLTDIHKKVKIGIYFDGELKNVVEGNGRAWVMTQLANQLNQLITDSSWAKVI